MVNNVPFDVNQGFSAWVSWLATSTDGWFFLLILSVLFIISIVPSYIKWGLDYSLFGVSFGVMIISAILFWLGGISEEAMFFFVLLFAVSVLKMTIFKE